MRIIGAVAAYRAEPDGTTLLYCPTPTLSINQNLYKDRPYDPAKFVPIIVYATLPRFVAIAWFALVAPPVTPEAIAQRINAAVVEVLKTPEVQKRFLDQGLTPVGNSPAEAAAFISEEAARWQNVIRSANIRLE